MQCKWCLILFGTAISPNYEAHTTKQSTEATVGAPPFVEPSVLYPIVMTNIAATPKNGNLDQPGPINAEQPTFDEETLESNMEEGSLSPHLL